MTQTPHSLIIGPGAIGSLLCANIQDYSQTWVYLHRKNLTLPNQAHISKLTSLRWQLLGNEPQRIDLIWVCCKADQSVATASKLLQKHKQATAILLHNGMGPQQQLAAQFPGRVIFAMTTNAACKEDDQLFHQKAFGITNLGYPNSVNRDSPNWIDDLANWTGNMNFQADHNIYSSLWRKLAINAVINPLTAYYQIKNGTLAEPQYSSTIQLLCEEITKAALADGVELTDLFNTVNDVIKLTADNYSSMNQDVKLGRHTEVEFILGYILRCADKHYIQTPKILYWYKKILSLQEI